MFITWNAKEYDGRHGGPFDRGAADCYYRRRAVPHYFVGATHMSEEIKKAQMTEEEIQAYRAGYEWQKASGNKKVY